VSPAGAGTAVEIDPFHVEIPREQLDDLRRRIAATRWPSKRVANDAQGVVLEGAAHWVAEQAPEELLAALAEFLAPYRERAGARGRGGLARKG
jgi:hypothetical protein